MLENLDVEVDQEPELQASEFQVGEYLRGMNRLKSLDGFELQQNRILNHEVGSKTNLDHLPTVGKRYWTLTVKGQFSCSKLVRETSLVRTFQEAGTERAVHLHCRTDDLLAKGINIHGYSLRSLRALRFKCIVWVYRFGPSSCLIFCGGRSWYGPLNDSGSSRRFRRMPKTFRLTDLTGTGDTWGSLNGPLT